RVAWLVRVCYRIRGGLIERYEGAPPPSEPQRTGMILINCPNEVCQAGRMIGNRPVCGKPVRRRIESAPRALFPNPYLTVSVSINRVDIVRNQAVGVISVMSVVLELL